MEDSGDSGEFEEPVFEKNPQTNAMLALALSHHRIGLGSDEHDIDEALKQFGLPLPESHRLQMWEGLASHDEAKWLHSYNELQEFLSTHEDEIKVSTVASQILKALNQDNLQKTLNLVETFLPFDKESEGHWIQLLNLYASQTKPKPKPKPKPVPMPSSPSKSRSVTVPSPERPKMWEHEKLQDHRETKRVAEQAKITPELAKLKLELKGVKSMIQELEKKKQYKQQTRLLKLLTFLAESDPFPSNYSKGAWKSTAYEIQETMKTLNKFYSKQPGGEQFKDSRFFRLLYKERFAGTDDYSAAQIILDAVKDYYLPFEEQLAGPVAQQPSAEPFVTEIHHQNQQWKVEYREFFGTNVCMEASDPQNKDFMRAEFYKLWVRLLSGDGYSREDIAEMYLPTVMRNVVPVKPYGLVPATKYKKRTELFKWYNKIKNNSSTDNFAVWQHFAKTAILDEPSLKLSNFAVRKSTFYKKHPNKRKRKLPEQVDRKVKFAPVKRIKKEDPQIQIKFQKFSTDPSNYSGLISILKREANESRRGVYKSRNLVSDYLQFPGLLAGSFDLMEYPDVTKAKMWWHNIMEDYVLLITPLRKTSRVPAEQYVPTRANFKEKISDRAMKTLHHMHERLVSVMVHREFGPPDVVDQYRQLAKRFYPNVFPREEVTPKKKPKPKPKPTLSPESRELMSSLTGEDPHRIHEADLRKMTLMEQATQHRLPPSNLPPVTPPKKRRPSPTKSEISELGISAQLTFLSTPVRKIAERKIAAMDTPERQTEIKKLHAMSPQDQKEYLEKIQKIKKYVTLRVTESRPGLKSFRNAQPPPPPRYAGVSFQIPRAQTKAFDLEESKSEETPPRAQPHLYLTGTPSKSRQPSRDHQDDLDDITSLMSGSSRRMRPTPASQDFNLFMRMREQAMQHHSARRLRFGSAAPSVRTRRTFGTARAQYDFPISRSTVIRLNEIKRRMGKKVDLFDDAQSLGFNKKHWEKKLYEKFPIDFSEGFKQHLGSFIKTNFNDRKREFVFVVRRKATQFQINSLIAVIESKTPPFHQVNCFIKRKVWEEVYNLNTLYSLQSYITSTLKETPKTYMKLTW